MTDKEFLKQVSLKLKCQRIMVELSINDVAEKTGLSYATINHMEKGAKDFHVLNIKRVATVYGIDMKEMF